MRRTIFFLLLMLVSQANAVTLDRIRFSGNRTFSSSELNGFLALQTGKGFSPDFMEMRMVALVDSMYSHNFPAARIDSFVMDTIGRNRTLRVYVLEGEQFRFGKISWYGDSARVPNFVWPRLQTVSAAPFHWENLEQDANLILDAFENAGYPFARIDVDTLQTDSAQNRVEVAFRITSGPLTQISFVRFAGLRSASEDYLARETRLKKGELFDQRRMDSAQRRLRRLEFLRRVDPARLTLDDIGHSGVEFDVEEARLSRIDAVAGFQPGSENESGTLTGLVDVELLNLLGSGRKGKVHWERPAKSTQQIDLAYVEPWILRQPLSLRFDFSQRIQDTVYVTRYYGVKLSSDLSAVFSVWTAYRNEAVIVDSVAQIEFGLIGSATDYVEAGFALDTRDHPTNPREGVFFSTFAGRGYRRSDYSPPGTTLKSFTQERVGVDTEVAHELFPYWIAAVGVHARALESNEPEILLPDLYRLGGARTLRGYREEQFLGSRIGWASLEARYWVGTASRIFVFSDAGGFYRATVEDGIETSQTLIRYSNGVGIRLETGLGVWGIDYGVGQGENPLQGKLHVSLQSSF